MSDRGRIYRSKATKLAHKRAKDARQKPGEHYKEIALRGLGRKNKTADFFPTRPCGATIGGRKVYVRKEKELPNGDIKILNYQVIVGGAKCTKPAVTTHKGEARCAKHVGVANENRDEKQPKDTHRTPRSGQHKE
jgi:hypothetical protein